MNRPPILNNKGVMHSFCNTPLTICEWEFIDHCA